MNFAWASPFTDRPWCMFFSTALHAARCEECVLYSQEIRVQEHRKVAGWHCRIPVTFSCIPLLFNAYRSFCCAYRGLCSSPFYVIDILLLITSFCSLSFCTWCCFYSADKEGFLKSSLQILLYPVFCISDRLSSGISVLQGFSCWVVME